MPASIAIHAILAIRVLHADVGTYVSNTAQRFTNSHKFAQVASYEALQLT